MCSFIMTFTDMQMSYVCLHFCAPLLFPLSMAAIIGVLPHIYPAFRVPFL